MAEDSERKYIPAENVQDETLEVSTAGFVSLPVLVAETGRGYRFIQKAASKHIAEHPDWAKTAMARTKPSIYYSDALANIIRKEVSEFQPAPPGWQTYEDSSKILDYYAEGVKKLAIPYRKTHPEWFKFYLNIQKRPFEHYAPELIETLRQQIALTKEAPPGWGGPFELAKELATEDIPQLPMYNKIRRFAGYSRKQHPEWFKDYRTKTGTSAHYHPDLVDKIKKLIAELPPKGWLTAGSLAGHLKRSKKVVIDAAEFFRESNKEWFKNYTSNTGDSEEHFSPELIRQIELKFADKAPAGWMTQTGLCDLTKRSEKKIQPIIAPYRESHPQWFKDYWTELGILQHFAPELVEIVANQLSREQNALPGWQTVNMLTKETGRPQKLIESLGERLGEGHPEWFRGFRIRTGRVRKHFSPELIQLIKQEFAKRKEEESEIDESKIGEDGVYVNPRGERWITQQALIKLYGFAKATVRRKLHGLNSLPGTSRGTKIYFREDEALAILEPERQRREVRIKQENLQSGFSQEVEKITNNPELLEKFKIWISIFGAYNAADILFAHNPQYRGVREELVKGIIADYLGDVLVSPPPFNPKDLQFVEKRFLENPNIQEGLYTCLIQACSAYLTKQRANPETAAGILEQFMMEIGEKIPVDAQDLFLEIIVKVATYFRCIFDNWRRPGNMIGNIAEGRNFPDTTQIINILEIKEKHRLLIADRMGVGKSASVIAAKEYLGLRQALAIIPANVIPTWQKYLSEQKDGGYFLEERQPKVFTTFTIDDLTSEEATQADYVIISQERFNDEYAEALKQLNAEMLIVDEVHEFKSATGVRSQALQNLSRKFESPDKYVTLLSGTPAPNKVSDIAIILKLLYPERFADMLVKTIVRQIIYGDITDLRALLVPRMQRKTLAEVVEMPKLVESETDITLNPWFQKAYEAILQDDDLNSAQKIIALRQILLNPEILELRPPTDNRMDKIVQLEQDIERHFEAGRRKIIIVFNNYVEGITRGENNLVDQVKLPVGLRVEIIDGNTAKDRRIEIQKLINESDEPIALYLSGDTATVGIDLSGAHVVIEYNEPWSKELKAQQIGRSYRPGLKNELIVQTYITSGTIEEGIHRYTELKDKAIQKLLIGVELTELEKRLLEEDESIEGENFEVDAELASYYLNSFQDLLAMFKSIKNIGEARFSQFLAKYGERYASNYDALGDRSYQSNVARLSANIISRVQNNPKGLILDLASGPQMLKNKSLNGMQDRIISLDINQSHFFFESNGEDAKQKPGVEQAVVAGMSHIPLAKESVATVNLALGLHYTSFRPSQNDFERLQVICEINRVLTIGGRTIITLQHGTELKDEESFKNLIGLAGFEIDTQYTGQAQGENFQAQVYTLIKKESADFETLKELIAENQNLTDSLKLRFGGHAKSFKDTRKILTEVDLGDQTLKLELNQADQRALEEEQSIYQLGDTLKQIHGELKAIPNAILREHSFARIKLGNRYILFKNLEVSKGIVLIK
jgi:SNF2 family DNA or RNA helicase/ubiquinone/menaquinone biosynthesis C-methylase UbiE